LVAGLPFKIEIAFKRTLHSYWSTVGLIEIDHVVGAIVPEKPHSTAMHYCCTAMLFETFLGTIISMKSIITHTVSLVRTPTVAGAVNLWFAPLQTTLTMEVDRTFFVRSFPYPCLRSGRIFLRWRRSGR
jgi:hypothetical protein